MVSFFFFRLIVITMVIIFVYRHFRLEDEKICFPNFQCRFANCDVRMVSRYLEIMFFLGGGGTNAWSPAIVLGIPSRPDSRSTSRRVEG